MLGTAVSHLVKGLDVEEAAAGLAVLAGLLAYRRRFDVEGCPDSIRPLLYTVAALGAAIGVLAASAAEAFPFPHRLEGAFAILTGALVFRCLYIWLRPLAAHLLEHEFARKDAERIVAQAGCDSLSFFALRDDKSYFFSPSGRSFLAYRVLHGVALVSGDPIGDDIGVRRPDRGVPPRGAGSGLAHGDPRLTRGAPSTATGPRPETGLSRRRGSRRVPREFSLEGRPIRKVRQSVTRLERAGLPDEGARGGPGRSTGLQPSSMPSRRSGAAAGRSAASPWPMDGLFAYPETLVAVAERADGHVGGFIHLVPVPATGGLSLASMRRAGRKSRTG